MEQYIDKTLVGPARDASAGFRVSERVWGQPRYDFTPEATGAWMTPAPEGALNDGVRDAVRTLVKRHMQH